MFKTDNLNCYSYSCSSISDDSKKNLRYTNKLLLPPSILYSINNLNGVEFPLFFKLTNKDNSFGRVCSVHEFTAPPGVIHAPWYIMDELGMTEGSNVILELVIPIKGSYLKLKPHTTEFINLSNPKAVLEKILSRDYSVITEGHTIALNYKEINKIFYIDIVETKPSNIIQIINTDVNVDFDKPMDYVEPKSQKKEPKKESTFKFNNNFFKESLESQSLSENKEQSLKPKSDNKFNKYKKNNNNTFVPFSGKGHKLGN